MRRTLLYRLCVGAGLLIFAGPRAWANSPPEVTNVTAAQRIDGSRLVDIGYDLADADWHACIVWVVVSDDGGVTWDVPAVTFTGDVGGVAPGTGKQIIWDAYTDLPWAYGSDYVVRVYADDMWGMMLVPGGEFLMGDHFDEGEPNELPAHAVYVDSFFMDIYEVSNQRYADALNWAQTS